MSFASTVKNELSKLELNNIESITYLSALLRNNATVVKGELKISTENSSVARQIFNLIKRKYNISLHIVVRKGYNYNKNYIYLLLTKNKVNIIVEDLNLNRNVPLEYLISDDNLVRIYLRGLFVSTASINDPKKSGYHLEFITDNLEYSNFVLELLNRYDLNSKIIKRENRFMVYIKEGEKIGDFLRMVNAIQALLYFEDIRIYRDHKNMVNRLNNCEQANVDKIIETASNQIKDIELISNTATLEILDEKTKLAAIYRLKYRDSSLQELSEIISMETKDKITKSGLHHRLKKIQDIANKIRESGGSNGNSI